METQQSRTAKTFDQYKDNYSQSVDEAVSFTGLTTDFFTRVKADYILDSAATLQADQSKLDVVDIGCGVGNYHPLLRPHFGSLTGIDVSSECIATAQKRGLDVQYEVYGGDKLPFDEGSFDLAFTICVMHHVPTAQWAGFAREMYRVLKPGGVALVFEHNPQNPLTMRAVNNCPFDEDAVLMRSRTTLALFADAGFKSSDAHFILTVPPVNAFMRQIDRLFSRLPLGAQYYVTSTK